ncbi:MAG: PAP/fibrillin family protein [Trichodesmium sp. ALOHA_ZT_67]|nr:PAP/fibrillin family protein [Trichodesmium sp. ALOHA_ZT_67]
MNNIATILETKMALREALKTYDGDVTNQKVKAKIEQLSQLNPIEKPTHSSLLESHWLLISAPSFPQGQKLSNGKYAYTLGKLAFNMFQPTNLKLVIDSVKQPVVLLGEKSKRSHDIVVEFSIIDELFPPLKGIVRNLAVCYPVDNKNLQAEFTGGIFAPQKCENLSTWKDIFVQAKASKKGLKEQLMSVFFKLMFGLTPPQGMNTETGEISFTMKRSPKGRLEILFLDEELRITKGKKENILIFERMV